MKYVGYFIKIFTFTLIFLIFLISCTASDTTSYAGKNTGDPTVPTRKINRVYPPKKDNTRYLGTNKKKKKKWTKIKQTKGCDCPWSSKYSSTAEKKIEKKLSKKR